MNSVCPRGTLLPRAGGNSQSCTPSHPWGACAVKWRCCCPQEQSNESCTLLHSSIPFLPSVSYGFLSSHQHRPERYKGSWLLQNIIANILRHSPNIAEIFCPYITVLYIFFYLASAHWIFFFCPFLTIVTQILNFFSLLSGTMRIFLALFQMVFTSLIQKGIIPHYIFGLIIRWWRTIDW